MKKLKRGGLFSDIHFGRKNNSKIHNQDCANYIDWFCSQCKVFDVDHVVFLGDWFEERQAIDSLTAKIALDCARQIDSLGIPVYFIVGNHDLYYRDNREVFATYVYSSLSNFVMIDRPTINEDTVVPTLLSPFLFEPEYPDLAKYFDIPVWMGHFEFKGFVLTGDTVKKESGPDPDKYSAPTRIFSGHFHKRQSSKNISYIGNTFPMDFGDVNDVDRGMAIYDYEADEVQYINWEDCPRYTRINLSELMEKPSVLKSGARVKCIADIDITYNQNSELKKVLTEKYSLRELTIEEVMTVTVNEGELTEEEIEMESTNNLVRKLIQRIESDEIDNQKLLDEYDKL